MFKSKRIISLIGILSMLFTMIPQVVFADTSATEGSSYAQERVIAVFSDEASNKEIKETVKEEDTTKKAIDIYDTEAEENIAVLEVKKGVTVDEAIDELEANKNVEYAQPDFIYETQAVAKAKNTVNDKEAGNQWHLDKVGMPRAWQTAKNAGYSTVKVAVLDTGYDIKHADLKKNINRELSIDITTGDRLGKDIDGHGTHVTGIIGATANNKKGTAGLASSKSNNMVDIIDVNIFTKLSNGVGAYNSDVVKGINYAVQNGAKVINMSIGGWTSKNQLLENAINNAKANGVTVVCAAGNEATSKATYPSDYEGAISVIASTKSGDRASYSNYGKAKDIAAPGSGIYSTLKGSKYGSMSGTSMAAPVVAATAAMMYAVNPDIVPDKVRSILMKTAKAGGTSTGAGIVNSAAAVRAAIN